MFSELTHSQDKVDNLDKLGTSHCSLEHGWENENPLPSQHEERSEDGKGHETHINAVA